MNLWHDFITNKGKPIHKLANYFPVYERYFSPWRNRSLTFIEIGVWKGGSLGMWQRYFGPMAKIVGIDINPECKQHEAPGIFVRIGDQKDNRFLDSILNEFGTPDIVLDDGSHQQADVYATYEYIYPLMGKNSIYMVEDVQCGYWPEYRGNGKHFLQEGKAGVDDLNADLSRGAVTPNYFTRQTYAISFYAGMVVFEKGDVFNKESMMTGAG